ncbi:hypothetical protein ACXYRR_02265 [Mycoplasma sp. 246B]
MYSYTKYKINIEKKQFYILLILLALLTAVLLIWVLIPFGYGINTESVPIEIRSDADKLSEFAKNHAIATLVAYIANTLVLVFFLIYLLLLRSKLKAGYIFFTCWIIVFILLTGLPFFKGTSYMSNFQIITGTFISIFSFSTVIALFTFSMQYHIQRKLHYYEWVKIHKGKAR